MDATDETGRYGRLINHSLKNPNCATKVIKVVNKTYDHLSLIINDFSKSFANCFLEKVFFSELSM